MKLTKIHLEELIKEEFQLLLREEDIGEETIEAKLIRVQSALKDILETELPNMRSDIKRLSTAASNRKEAAAEKAETELKTDIEELPDIEP